MSLIINIDTYAEKAHISIAKNGVVLNVLWSESQKNHASFLQKAVGQLIVQSDIYLKDVDAIAVIEGPGSYTGLRVGMSSAKGFCYALKKPLITLGTLEVLTNSALYQLLDNNKNILFCPMVDARRMEVFLGIYDKFLTPILSDCAMILEEISLKEYLDNNEILFFGSGAKKWKSICKHKNALFQDICITPKAAGLLSYQYFLKKKFSDLIYCEPRYLKEFQEAIKK